MSNLPNGRKSGKGFSMTSRHPDRDAFGNPGPGRYRPEQSVNITGRLNPRATSFGYRNLKQKHSENPAPNAYRSEDGFGSFHFLTSAPNCPGVKLGVKHKVFTTEKNPGPGTYEAVNPNVNKSEAPSYSVTPKSYK